MNTSNIVDIVTPRHCLVLTSWSVYVYLPGEKNNHGQTATSHHRGSFVTVDRYGHFLRLPLLLLKHHRHRTTVPRRRNGSWSSGRCWNGLAGSGQARRFQRCGRVYKEHEARQRWLAGGRGGSIREIVVWIVGWGMGGRVLEEGEAGRVRVIGTFEMEGCWYVCIEREWEVYWYWKVGR